MAGLDASELYVAGTGNIYTAPIDTALPTDVTTPAATPWVDHGFATEDGVEFTFGKTTDDIKGWQSFDSLRTITTDAPKSLKFTLMQSNEANLQLALGGGTVDAEGVYTPPPSSEIDIRAIFITANDGGEVWAFWAPRVMLSDNVVIPWKKSGEAELPLTFSIQAAPAPFQFVFPTEWSSTILATGATAGEPGAFTPAGASAPLTSGDSRA
jgi:hypothetical protein